ncbi:MAG: universal stress protein UspA [Herpetosiphonaceae bacterium]|nr:MAG: universal stress protein UspA [Herpetosiphonaceae bacterium]
MERQILVPLDGSPLAELALPQAVAMAQAIGSGLTLIRVIRPTAAHEIIGFHSKSRDLRWMDEIGPAHEYLTAVAGRLRATGLQVSTRIEEGDPAERIVARADYERSIALIAMATHGRSGLRRWLMGSVAEKVLYATPKPLLLVRIRKETTPQEIGALTYTRILVPLDVSSLAEQALDAARTIAAATGAALTLVSVTPTFEDLASIADGLSLDWIEDEYKAQQREAASYLAEKEKQLAEQGIPVGSRVLAGDPAEEILRAATLERADLIVMATHGRSGIQRLWYGSVASRIIQAAELPVLLIRPVESEEGAAEDSAAHRAESMTQGG